MRELLGAFEEDALHCIKNNPKNDNFKFGIRARDDNECLEVMDSVKENVENFIFEISKVIGECDVLFDYNNVMITIKRKHC